MPILRGENVWIGLERAQQGTVTEITLVLPAEGCILTRTCPPDHAIKGVLVGQQYRAFSPGDVLNLLIGSGTCARTTCVQIGADVADKALGASICRVLFPLNRRAGYGGTRLP
ncbi:MAG: hypothetical protein KKC55_17080 [Gammaproteobacteria bacterium]|nr:hypothetical protein [Gammaproteobacteria bacterium]